MQEEVVTGSPTDGTVINPAASSSSAGPVTQAGAPVSANAPPPAVPRKQDNKQQQERSDDSLSESISFGKLRFGLELKASLVLNTSRTPQGPKSMIAVAMDVGEDQYLPGPAVKPWSVTPSSQWEY